MAGEPRCATCPPAAADGRRLAQGQTRQPRRHLRNPLQAHVNSLITALAAIAVGCALQGCERPAGAPDDAEPRQFVLRRGLGGEPATLDPALASDNAALFLLQDLFEGLTTEAPDGRIVPGAAERWTTSTDQRRWTFHLRRDLRWSDGQPLSAADFVAGLDAVRAAATEAPYAELLAPIVATRAPDPLTVVIELAEPVPQLPVVAGDAVRVAAARRHDGCRFRSATGRTRSCLDDRRTNRAASQPAFPRRRERRDRGRRLFHARRPQHRAEPLPQRRTRRHQRGRRTRRSRGCATERPRELHAAPISAPTLTRSTCGASATARRASHWRRRSIERRSPASSPAPARRRRTNGCRPAFRATNRRVSTGRAVRRRSGSARPAPAGTTLAPVASRRKPCGCARTPAPTITAPRSRSSTSGVRCSASRSNWSRSNGRPTSRCASIRTTAICCVSAGPRTTSTPTRSWRCSPAGMRRTCPAYANRHFDARSRSQPRGRRRPSRSVAARGGAPAAARTGWSCPCSTVSTKRLVRPTVRGEFANPLGHLATRYLSVEPAGKK